MKLTKGERYNYYSSPKRNINDPKDVFVFERESGTGYFIFNSEDGNSKLVLQAHELCMIEPTS
jgi:hypothetical protein